MSARRETATEALHDVATTIQAAESVEEVCAQTVSAAADILAFNQCSILIREDEWLVPYALSEGALPDGSRRMRIDQGLAGATYQSGDAAVVDEVEPSDETDPAKESYRSGISVPIGEHGVFQAVSTDTAAFDDGDVELAELLVSHTITALDRLKREQELTRQNERLDQFVSVVSHDLRNPLNIASGRLDLATEDCDSPHLEVVADAHDRMERLIEDLLEFARAGSDVIDRTVIELPHALDECWTGMHSDDATLVVETDRTIRADRTRFRQLLENLFTNALDHGGPGVTVTVGDVDGGFYFEDDGPGIDAPDREDVFQAGYTTTTHGTGFGLSIVEQVADIHGWEIHPTARSGGGARFEITGVEIVG